MGVFRPEESEPPPADLASLPCWPLPSIAFAVLVKQAGVMVWRPLMKGDWNQVARTKRSTRQLDYEQWCASLGSQSRRSFSFVSSARSFVFLRFPSTNATKPSTPESPVRVPTLLACLDPSEFLFPLSLPGCLPMLRPVGPLVGNFMISARIEPRPLLSAVASLSAASLFAAYSRRWPRPASQPLRANCTAASAVL